MSYADKPIVDLVQKYAPMLYFHPDEPYKISSTDWYLQSVVLSGPGQRQGPPVDPKTIPGGEWSRAFFLQIPDQSPAIRNGNPANARVYVHVLSAPGNEGHIDIQYWFFYAFNGPATYHVAAKAGADSTGEMPPIGEHQGDWEHVTVRVDTKGEGKIVAVFYSQHSGGTWYTQASKPGAEDGYSLAASTHPIVYVAKNTHANYPWAGTFTIGGFDRLKIITFKLIDRTAAAPADPGWSAGERCDIVKVTLPGKPAANEPQWLAFKGHWGPRQEAYLNRGLLEQIIIDALKGVPWLVALFASPYLPEAIKLTLVGAAAIIATFILHFYSQKQEGPLTPSAQSAWKGDTQSIEISRFIAEDQESRVSKNFPLTYPGRKVVWQVVGLAQDKAPAITFTVMEDKPNRKDQPRLEQVRAGTISDGEMGGNPRRLYAGRLTYSDPATGQQSKHLGVFDQLGIDSFHILPIITD